MELDLTKPGQAKQYMSAAIDKEGWNNRCDAVKSANDGCPAFWGSDIRPLLFEMFPDAGITLRQF
jgi:hypothetical protein